MPYICILRVRFSLYWKKKRKKKKKHIHVTLPSTGLTEHSCNRVPGLSQSQIHLTFVCVFYYRGTSSWNEFCLVLKSRPGFLILIDYFYTRGGTQYKRPYGDMPPTWVAKSASWYLNDPLKSAKFGIWMSRFFKIFPNLSQNWLKFKKILENIGRFCSKFCPKLSRLVYEWVTFSWKLVFVWVYFQILRRHLPTKTKLVWVTLHGFLHLILVMFLCSEITTSIFLK